MARAEKAPEQRSIPFRRGDRGELLEDLTTNGRLLRGNLVFNSPNLDPYVELWVVLRELDLTDDLERGKQRHLRRMGSLESNQREAPVYNPEASKLWEYAESRLEPEWSKAQTFLENLSDTPKSWQAALDDLIILKANLREAE